MRFSVAEEHRHFADSVRGAIADWEPEREPDLGAWLDDHDEGLATRLAAVGWAELWAAPELLSAAVAGGKELGRACAPLSLVDIACLGALLWIDGRARHGVDARTLAAPAASGGLVLAAPAGNPEPEPERTLDATGTVRVAIAPGDPLPAADAETRWATWNAATLAYLAGLADRALGLAVDHVRSREQFGAPLGSLPAVQARLADAALARDGIELLAWRAAGEPASGHAERAWAGAACCELTAAAQQVHGAVGFALETGLHRLTRRARAAHAWSLAVSRALR